jgi:hypothetical protein
MMQKGNRTIFLLTACVMLALLFYYKSYFNPVNRDILTADRDISALQTDMESVQNITEEIQEISTNRIDLESQLKAGKAKLPDELDPYDIILLLSAIDQNILIRNSIIFLDPIERTDYIILPVRFHFSSSYSGFLKMLSFLNSLYLRPSISNMQISGENIRDSMDESDKVIYNLDVEMTLNFYLGRD